MLSTFDDIRTDAIRKLGISTTAAFYSDSVINDWVKQATRWATSFKKWPFTEGRVSTTYTSSVEEWSFEGYKADSIRMLLIGGKRFQKMNFEDYLIVQEEDPQNTEKLFSDYGRLVFVSTGHDASGTLVAYGQYTPTDWDTTDNTQKTVFSDGDEEGNEAIVEQVLYYAKTREQNENEANDHHARAESILNNVWARTQDEQYAYQTARQRGGMFKRINVVGGGMQGDLIRRDQFPFG